MVVSLVLYDRDNRQGFPFVTWNWRGDLIPKQSPCTRLASKRSRLGLLVVRGPVLVVQLILVYKFAQRRAFGCQHAPNDPSSGAAGFQNHLRFSASSWKVRPLKQLVVEHI